MQPTKKLNACVNAQIESELKPLIVFKKQKKHSGGSDAIFLEIPVEWFGFLTELMFNRNL